MRIIIDDYCTNTLFILVPIQEIQYFRELCMVLIQSKISVSISICDILTIEAYAVFNKAIFNKASMIGVSPKIISNYRIRWFYGK